MRLLVVWILTSPGIYKLNNDLIINDDLSSTLQLQCIKIKSSDVTFDCQNHEFRYNSNYFLWGDSSEHLWLKPWGIFVDTGPDTNPLNLHDVTIKNCNINNWPFSIVSGGSGSLELSLENNDLRSITNFASGNGVILNATNNKFFGGVQSHTIWASFINNEFYNADGEYWHNDSGYVAHYRYGLRVGNSFLKNNYFHNNIIGLYPRGPNMVIDNNQFSNNTMHIGSPGDFPMSISASWNISTTNTFDGKPVYFLKDKHNYNVPSNAAWVACFNCSNIHVSGISIDNADVGVYFSNTINSVVEDSTIKAKVPISLNGDNSGNLIKSNTLTSIHYGYSGGDYSTGLRFTGYTTNNNPLIIKDNIFEYLDTALYTKPLINSNVELVNNTVKLRDLFLNSADGFILDFENSFNAEINGNTFECINYTCGGTALELRDYSPGGNAAVTNNKFIRILRAIQHSALYPGDEPAVIENNYFSLYPLEKGELFSTYGSSLEGPTKTGFNNFGGTWIKIINSSHRWGMYRLGGVFSPASRPAPDPPNKRGLLFFKIDDFHEDSPSSTKIEIKYDNLSVDDLTINESSLKLYRYNTEFDDWEAVNATQTLDRNTKTLSAVINGKYFLKSVAYKTPNIFALMGNVTTTDNQPPVITFTGETPRDGETIDVQQEGNIRKIFVSSNEQLESVILQYQMPVAPYNAFYTDFPDLIKEVPMKMRYLPYNEQQPLDFNGVFVSPYEWYCDNIKKYHRGHVVDMGCFKTNFNQKYRFRVIATDLSGNTLTTDWITFNVVGGADTGFLNWSSPTPDDNSLVTELPLDLKMDLGGNCNPPISSATLLIKLIGNDSKIERFIPPSTMHVKITNTSLVNGNVTIMRTAIGGFTCGDIKTKPLHLEVNAQNINQQEAENAFIQLFHDDEFYDSLELGLNSDTTISEAVVEILGVNHSMELTTPFSARIKFKDLGLEPGVYNATAFARISGTDLWVASNPVSFKIKCRDYDDFNPFVESTTKNISEQVEDYCQGNNVVEYYCKPVYRGGVVIDEKIVNCSSCVGGACVDTQKPFVKLKKPRLIEHNDFDVEFSVVDNGAVDVDSIRYFIDSENSEPHIPKCVTVKGVDQWQHFGAADCFDNINIPDDGEHTIIIKGADKAGNSFSYDFAFTVNRSLADQNYKYVIIANKQGTIAILNVSPYGMVLKDSLNIGARITALASQDNKLFVGDAYGNVHVVDFSNPQSIYEIATYTPEDYGYDENKSISDMKVVDDKLFISFKGKNFRVLDISNIQNPEIVQMEIPHAGSRLFVTGNYLISYSPTSYLYTPTNYLYTYDIHNLRYMSNKQIEGGMLYGSGNTLISASKNGRLLTLDMSDITNIHVISLYWLHNLKYIPGIIKDVAIKNNYAFIAASGYGVLVLDISNPEWLELVSHYNTMGDSKSVDVLQNKLLLADGDALLLFNITNPHNMELLSSFNDPSIGSVDFVIVPSNTVSSRS